MNLQVKLEVVGVLLYGGDVYDVFYFKYGIVYM